MFDSTEGGDGSHKRSERQRNTGRKQKKANQVNKQIKVRHKDTYNGFTTSQLCDTRQRT